jgi:hypothetical protein
LNYLQHTIVSDDGDHQWAVVLETCDIADDDDRFLLHAADAIRIAYGEEELRAMAENAGLLSAPDPADSVGTSFATDHLIRALRSSLPNPDNEGNKPPHLTNYRSETSEIIARAALSTVYGFAVPPALHATKGNRNQPILGFDGWAVMALATGELALVLLQVKATDDAKRPPGEAAKLILECGRVVTDAEKLQGFLIACTLRCKGTIFATPLMEMAIELETTNRVSNTVVSPVIVRGTVTADLEDLKSLRSAKESYSHAKARGMTLSIGTELTAFGRAAMNRARSHG